MTSLLEGAKQLLTRGTDIGGRIEALTEAAEAARGVVDDEVVDSALEVCERAAGRLRLSAGHTVVAIAGATGSGKSSTFNALTGLELSAVGVRRPTTSWATACVWGTEGAGELLDWLGIPPRHQTTRDSMLDTRRESHALEGVVLLDLPDHDSTEVSHHLEVDRLVALSDMFVWVLDPQKYADAAIHDRYLAPLRTHAEVMVVALNHIDTVPEERRESMVADVRRLLADDGLPDVPVIPVSARHGQGLDALRAEIERRVADKKSTVVRYEADIAAAATRLREATGTAPSRELPPARVQALEEAVAEAAGVPTIVEGVERAARVRATRSTGWPLVSWVSRLRADPAKKLELDLGAAGKQLRGSSSAAPETTAVERARVDHEVRALVDEVSAGMGPGWSVAVRDAATQRLGQLGDSLDAGLAGVTLNATRLPVWAGVVGVLQWLLVLAALGGAGWTVATAASGTLDETPQVLGIAVPLVLLAGSLVLGLLLGLVCRGLVGGTARTRAAKADENLRGVVHDTVSTLVAQPVSEVLGAHHRTRSGVDTVLGG
ncbi:GTPase [Nocardioides bruguierae]|uniref:50S ribosome-binding GTPase n=1 Tax=Nocardioides bruguierae TaxID=2945102 RepID=A0A9X2D988_9ACTN|nr:GTPase [Nocardioides bruguierae]MCM0620414.1 50S ribosome-binding GTPase [Nocardioides bruguierae]